MTHALVRHIVRQGVYDSKDIANLTPYSGQLQKLRAAIGNDFEIVLSQRDKETLVKDGFFNESQAQLASDQAAGLHTQKTEETELLRVRRNLQIEATLANDRLMDNFQGEEAKAINVSLIRSNEEKNAGFLKTTNRINVLLSRAQHGMFGNADTYSNVPMWSQVLDMLRVDNSVGDAFDICCPRHPQIEILIASPEDFATLSAEGGRQKACDR